MLSLTEYLVPNVARRILIRTHICRTANKTLPPVHIFVSRNPRQPFVKPWISAVHSLTATGLDHSDFEPELTENTYLVSQSFGLTLGPVQPSSLLGTGIISQRYSGRGVMLTSHHHVALRLGMNATSYTSAPSVCLCGVGQGQRRGTATACPFLYHLGFIYIYI
jgi:hypothetical protein